MRICHGATRMQAMATVHLVHGFLGSGKTTYAEKLSRDQNALRLSLDEWYLNLFSDGMTKDLDPVAQDRLVAQLNKHWPTLVDRGIDVVLDWGFWKRESRDEVRRLATEHSAQAVVHSLQCDDQTALQRCLARNGSPGSFLVDPVGFTRMKEHFEVLGVDESRIAIDTSGKAPKISRSVGINDL